MNAVESYIWEREDNEREIMLTIRDMVHSSATGITEKIRYTLPFFDRHAWICYMNPLKTGGIEVCFMKGRDLVGISPLLDQKDRKLVAGITITSTEDLESFEAFHVVLTEAIRLDELSKK